MQPGSDSVLNERVADHGPTPPLSTARARHRYTESIASPVVTVRLVLLTVDEATTEPLAFCSSNSYAKDFETNCPVASVICIVGVTTLSDSPSAGAIGLGAVTLSVV